MKIVTSILATVVTAVLVLSGCSKSGGSVDASPIEKSFASADATLKGSADKAVSAIKNADYSGATVELQKLAANVKLTDDQKKAINDVLARVQKAVTDAGSKVADDAKKVVGDALMPYVKVIVVQNKVANVVIRKPEDKNNG